MAERTCFIISPIGKERSPEREHANDVFEFIIQPAMEECGIKAFRSDHLREPGLISEQMFGALVNETMCIAVLTGRNPNVYYELAIAQAAGRPVIILLEKGEALPFDIQDLRCVYYDLGARSFRERTYIKEVVEHLHAIEAGGWKGKSPFDALLQGRRATQNPNVRFFHQSIEFGNSDGMLQLLASTSNAFDSLGMSLNVWRRAKDFRQLLARKAADGCKARFLLLHPRHPVIPHMINPAVDTETYEETVVKLESNYQFFTSLVAAIPNAEVRQIHCGYAHMQITRGDHAAVSTQYLFTERSRYSPLLHVTPGTPMYETLRKEFDAVWEANRPEVTTMAATGMTATGKAR